MFFLLFFFVFFFFIFKCRDAANVVQRLVISISKRTEWYQRITWVDAFWISDL